MAKSAISPSCDCPVIRKFSETIEKIIASSPIIVSTDIQKYFGPSYNSVYIKGSIHFIDSSLLELSLFVKEAHKAISIDKYRFHYMNNAGRMLFRYDNAPHYSELSSFPNHKHVQHRAIASSPPDLQDILDEISAILLKT
jgi:hypothetical protein